MLRVLAFMAAVVGCAHREAPLGREAPDYRAYVEKVDRRPLRGRFGVLGVDAAGPHARLSRHLVTFLRAEARTADSDGEPANLDRSLPTLEGCTDVACFVLLGDRFDVDYLVWGVLRDDQLALRIVRIHGRGRGVVHEAIIDVPDSVELLDGVVRAAYARLAARARGATVQLLGGPRMKVRLDGELVDMDHRSMSIEGLAAGDHRLDLELRFRFESDYPPDRSLSIELVTDDAHDVVIRLVELRGR